MERFKVVLIYVGLILAVAVGQIACTAKKNLIQEKVVTAESNTTKIETVSAPVVNQTLIIEEVCDSVQVVGDDGKVYTAPPKYKDFNYKFRIDSLEAEVKFSKNNFSLYVDQVARVLRQKDSIISEKNKEITKIKETVDIKTNWKVTWWAAAIGFVAGILVVVFKPWKLIRL